MKTAHRCSLCGSTMSKVIYGGLPGRLCDRPACCCLEGAADFAPAVSSEDDIGDPGFVFMAYEGSYWRVLWRWLTA
jgi:hypothetical protein